MIRAAAFVLVIGAATTADADGVTPVPYDDLKARLAGLFDFDPFPPLPEPGMMIDGGFGGRDFTFGESFVGLAPVNLPAPFTTHDAFDGQATAPLTLRQAAPGRNVTIAYHAGFGSPALFPLGTGEFPAIDTLGEGALALFFHKDIDAFGLRIHSDYPDPLGTRPPPGAAQLRFFARDGVELSRHDIPLDTGITSLGFTGSGIAGVLITNTDPGGIALDDFIYPIPGLSS